MYEKHKRIFIVAFWFVFPAILILNVVMIFPLLYSLGVSFTGWALSRPGSSHQFVGLQNYIDLLLTSNFWKSVQVTLTYGLISVMLELVIGIAFALMLDKYFFGRKIIRSLVVIPMVVTPAVVGMFWKLLFDEQQGVFNYFLITLGFGRVPWLNVHLALISAIIMEVWQWTPFITLIILAGLQSIKPEVLEAAKVDGASNRAILRYITFPFLIPYLFVSLLFRLTDALRDFDKIFFLTQGGPGMQTSTLSIYTFETGFRVFEVAKTSAISWLFMGIVLIVTFPFLRAMTQGIRQN